MYERPVYRFALAPIAEWIDRQRQQSWKQQSPWLDTEDAALPPAAVPTFAKVLCYGTPECPPAGPLRRLAADLERAGLISTSDTELRAADWQLTAIDGVFALRDRPSAGEPHVYLGEDGVRLLRSVLARRPAGRILEVGCGSGLVTSGLAMHADRVFAFDSVPKCVEATQKSAVLNGVASKVDAVVEDLRESTANDNFDLLVGNLPGVPTPPELPFHTSACGGPDGLELTRTFLEFFSTALSNGALRRRHSIEVPLAIMRLQSTNGSSGLRLATDLQELADSARLTLEVTSDSRMDYRVRNALTALQIVRQCPDLAVAEICERIASHAQSIDMRDYYSSNIVAYPGDGALVWKTDVVPNRLDRWSAELRSLADVPAVLGTYFRRMGRLPMNYWEIGSTDQVIMVAAHAPELFDQLSAGTTIAEATVDIFAEEFHQNPIGSAAIYEAANLLVDTALIMHRRRGAPPSAPHRTHSGPPGLDQTGQ